VGDQSDGITRFSGIVDFGKRSISNGQKPDHKDQLGMCRNRAHISVPASDALEVAHMEALKSLINATESEQEKHMLGMIV